MMKVNYTFSKSLSMADEDGNSTLPLYNLPERLYDNYGPSGYDRTHMFSAGWNYELPVGRGKKLQITNKFADALVGGWKVSGIFVAYSGTPFTVSGSGSSLQATGNSQTADLIGPVTKLGGKGPGTRTMRRSALSIRRSLSTKPVFTGSARWAGTFCADPGTGSSIRGCTRTSR